MASDTFQPLPFLNFPRKIRDQVYVELLCGFDPPFSIDRGAPAFDISWLLESANHKIDTAILRTSSQVHREAYAIMVKTNRFVQVKSRGGLPLRGILNMLRTPVVADGSHSEQFKGYTLAVTVATKKPVKLNAKSKWSLEPCTLMILARDLTRMCDTLTDADMIVKDFCTNLVLSMKMAPVLSEPRSRYKDSLTPFFTDETQEGLLQPFREKLRGVKNVRINGFVLKELAKSVQEEMALDASSDPERVLEDFRKLNERAKTLFRQQIFGQACVLWQEIVTDIEKVQCSGSWKGLVERGGTPFLERIAELYFNVGLNYMHVQLLGIQQNDPRILDKWVEDAFSCAKSAMKKDFWKKGFIWKPSNAQVGKFLYRQALFLRLRNRIDHIEDALKCIIHASQLLPDDAIVLKERQTILLWDARERGVDV
ncbi:hypothetical protein CC80DRAFT_577609 [Byssothecium circinans]|uniref:Uncharacterized protein n=1 Tax=Byssothecium circinans TaxID=147558 RepID=A0A6A5UBU8_9PLEO|nr:hypothetical protein CC80DRAFT_577609 [Byssothecium circinans]